ncbi:MAG: HAD family hydrolase [Methanotrichaceae archaeon]|nr:HAD family hydrolase [Methanotrichaceae archaeon]
MIELDEFGISGIKGLIFDCYNTLIEIKTDEDSLNTYEPVSKWLIYQGVKISPEDLMREYKNGVKQYMERRWEANAEVRVEEVLGMICKNHALWDVDEEVLGIETARAFRAGSLRRMQPFPYSLKLLQELKDYPKAVVSNGQRVFSELEMRFFGIYNQFHAVIFSSDFGHKKPDLRIFLEACKQLNLEPEEMLCIGDNYEHDIVPATKLGMKAMHIEEAWRLFKLV